MGFISYKLFQILCKKEKEIAIKEIGINEQFLVGMEFDPNTRYRLINNHHHWRNYNNNNNNNNNCFDLSIVWSILYCT